MRFLIFIIGLIILNSCDCYQVASGLIVDSRTNSSIEGASVSIKNNPSNSTISDKEGRFEISNITSGFKCPPMQIIIEHPDYRPQELTIPSGTVRTIMLESKKTVVTEADLFNDSVNFYKRFRSGEDYLESISLDFAVITDQPTTDTSNSITCKSGSYMSILPHSLVIDKYQVSMDEESWNTVLDDNMYYQSVAMESLNAAGINNCFNDRDKQYLIFIKDNREKIIIDQNKLLHAWGFILFNGKDVPTFWSGTDISKTIMEVY